MDCGIPFCHQGCPLGNLIPDWNDLVYRDRWQAAIERLHATNNFPEFTGTAVPGAVRGLVRPRHQQRPGDDQGDRGRDHRARVRRRLDRRRSRPHDAHRQARRRGRLGPGRPRRRRAAEPRRPQVTVFERADRIGGLLRYGIPEFKMEKRVLDRRLALMRAKAWSSGPAPTSASTSRARAAARVRRHRPRRRRRPAARPAGPGRELQGIHFAMEYLTLQNRRCEGDAHRRRRRHHRRRASTSSSSAAATPAPTASAPRIGRARASVHQLELLPRPPDTRAAGQPVAALAEHLPRLVRARGGRRARLLGLDAALHRRRRRPRARAARGAASRWCTRTAACSSRRSRQRVRAEGRPRAARDGIPRPGARAACSTSSA